MQVQRLDHPTPLIIIDDFLSDDRAGQVLDECIGLERIFMPASVLGGPSGSMINEKMRKNQVVYLDSVFRQDEKKSACIRLVLREGIFSEEAMKVCAYKNTGFEIINRCTRSENVLSRYGDGDFYGFHRDFNGSKANRLITAVYYVNKKKPIFDSVFDGGRLLIKGEPDLPIEPKHNRLVVFNSGALHGVEAVKSGCQQFADGRFSINIWMGFQN